MAFDISAPYIVVKSTQGIHYYLQGSTYYGVDSPYASVSAKDVGAVSSQFTVGAGAASVSRSGTTTDRSGAITTGGTSQQLMADNASRRYILIMNPSTESESLFINFTANASTSAGSSLEIIPGGRYERDASSYVTTEAVNVVAATTGHKFVAKEG